MSTSHLAHCTNAYLPCHQGSSPLISRQMHSRPPVVQPAPYISSSLLSHLTQPLFTSHPATSNLLTSFLKPLIQPPLTSRPASSHLSPSLLSPLIQSFLTSQPDSSNLSSSFLSPIIQPPHIF